MLSAVVHRGGARVGDASPPSQGRVAMGRNPKKAVVEGSAMDKLLERHMFDAVRRSMKPFDLGNYKVKSESQAACVKSLARLAPLLTDLYKSVPKGEIIKASCVKNGLLRLLTKHPQAHPQQ